MHKKRFYINNNWHKIPKLVVHGEERVEKKAKSGLFQE